MNTLAIADLPLSIALDRKALANVVGGDTWIQSSVSYSGLSAWSSYSRFYKADGGIRYVNGIANHYSYEGWTRTRTQTETSYWQHYVVA
jgi:hypothetical protein